MKIQFLIFKTRAYLRWSSEENKTKSLAAAASSLPSKHLRDVHSAVNLLAKSVVIICAFTPSKFFSPRNNLNQARSALFVTENSYYLNFKRIILTVNASGKAVWRSQ